MNTWMWILIGIAALIVVAIAVSMVVNGRRTTALKHQFGPEYERTVETSDSRRAAEADLRNREKEHAHLDLRQLPEAVRGRYVEQWRGIQEHFVEEPSSAVAEADNLLSQVMSARGYPVEDFEVQASLISVDHPDVVENYRFAHKVYTDNEVKRTSTENLREALLRYRSLFDELLRSDRPDEGRHLESEHRR